ncbi:MFS transporter [Ochrobactrum sp. Q0168]|uniref:MFS transporter n=1 Tax=Ochrobactrum sp. Q0168 TaxID=2793241 RepID=UPI0018EDEB67|nr:MFS transporter [Ochrobactrum sp. Q0168]
MTTTHSAASLAARLDRLPILGFHKKFLLLVGAGMFFDSFDIYLANSVLATLKQSGWSTLTQNATFLSATAVGMLIGSLLAGILGDRYGRKFTYQFNLAIFGFAAIACAFAPNMEFLIVARFISAIGMGAENIIGYGIISEFVPPAYRGRWAALLSCIAQAGLFFATLTAWLVIPTMGWQMMFIIVGIGAITVLIARKNIPESPRWLASKGRFEEAAAVVAEIEKGTDVSKLPPLTIDRTTTQNISADYKTFDPRFRTSLIVAGIAMIVQSVSIYGFVAWVPTILTQQGISLNASLLQSAFMTLGGPCGALLAFMLTDRIGRRPAIIGGSLLAAVVGPLFALVTSQVAATALGFVMFTIIYYLVSVVQAGYLPELFPTQVRMRATAVAVMAGRFASIGVPYAILFLLNGWGLMAVVAMVSVLLVIQIIAIALAGVETRHKSLEAITTETITSR